MSLTPQGESQDMSFASLARKEVPLPLCCLEDLRLMITERAWFLYWWLLHKWVILSYKHIILSSTSIYSTVPPRHHQDRQISWHKNWHSSPEEQWEVPEQDACREWRVRLYNQVQKDYFWSHHQERSPWGGSHLNWDLKSETKPAGEDLGREQFNFRCIIHSALLSACIYKNTKQGW